jgi:hypothetical protein
MPERLMITTMGRQRLVDRLKDRIFGAIYNLPLDATDERRAEVAATAVMLEGDHQEIADHGSWAERSTHQ